MGFLKTKKVEEFDDNEWADLDDLLPEDELDEPERPKKVKKKLEVAKKPKEVTAKKSKEIKKPKLKKVAEVVEDEEMDAAEEVDLSEFEEEQEDFSEEDFEAEAMKLLESEMEMEETEGGGGKVSDEEIDDAASSVRALEMSEAVDLAQELEELTKEVRVDDTDDTEEPAIVYRKLIAAFLYGHSVLDKPNVVLRASDEDMVLSEMRDGRITEQTCRNTIRAIKDPIKKYGEDGVDRRLGEAEKERRILAYMTGMGFNGWEDTDGVSLKKFVQKFPLPMDFEAAAEGFLKVIRSHSNEAGFREYVRAMENLKRKVYGLRKIYAGQLLILQKKAAELVKTEAGLIQVSQTEARMILEATEIRGDALVQGAIERKLTTQALLRNGLAPKWKMELSRREIAFSGAFRDKTRDVVLGYVKDDEKFIVRSYYRNNSQGVWRYLPDYALKENSAKRQEIWCGIGYAEEMFRLPAELQAKLSEIAMKEFVTPVDETEFLFVGSAKSYLSVEAYLSVRKKGELEGDVYREVALRPALKLTDVTRVRLEPKKLVLKKAGWQPNFKRKLFDWREQTTFYGRVLAETFRSVDGALLWTFMEDNRQQAWITGADVTAAELTSTGLLSEWAYMGDFGTAVMVSKSLADGYGNEKETHGSYISMWKKYVSKIGLVREYQRSKMDRKKVI